MEIDVTQIILKGEWFLRIFIACLCGGIIGYERKSRNKEAGIRTHAIIALASALIMIVSKYGFSDVRSYDAARIAAQIISGIGFIGAGVIFVKQGTISGLTTAAGMWATAGVGMAIGSGLYDMGIFTTLLILGLQMMFHRGVFLKLDYVNQVMKLEVIKGDNVVDDIKNEFKFHSINIHNINIDKMNLETMAINIEILMSKEEDLNSLITKLSNKDYFIKMNR
ncbi:MAG: MgtC/SapB family protein [Erysipelotrichaceae bacterium]